MINESVEPPERAMAPTEDEKPKVLKMPSSNVEGDNSNKGFVETMSLYTTIIAVIVVMIILIMIIIGH